MSEDALALARECAQALYQRDAAAQALGIRLLAVEPGQSLLSMTVTRDLCNGHDICHGGMLFTLADTAMAYASNSHNRVAVASSVNIDFLRSARYGDCLQAQAREVHRGGRKGSYQVDITNEADEVIAMFHGIVAYLDRSVLEEHTGES